MSNNEIEVIQRSQLPVHVRSELVRQKPTLETFLGSREKFERFGRALAVAFDSARALANCSPESVVSAALGAARLGLEIGGPQGQAYLVPYGKRCQLVIGYRGWLSVAKRSGAIRDAETILVHERDKFAWLPHRDPPIEHEPVYGFDDPGPVVCTYVRARVQSGDVVWHVVPGYYLSRVEKMAIAKAGDRDSPWKGEWREEMLKKVALSKFLRSHLDAAELTAIDSAESEAPVEAPVVTATVEPVAVASEPEEPKRWVAPDRSQPPTVLEAKPEPKAEPKAEPSEADEIKRLKRKLASFGVDAAEYERLCSEAKIDPKSITVEELRRIVDAESDR